MDGLGLLLLDVRPEPPPAGVRHWTGVVLPVHEHGRTRLMRTRRVDLWGELEPERIPGRHRERPEDWDDQTWNSYRHFLARRDLEDAPELREGYLARLERIRLWREAREAPRPELDADDVQPRMVVARAMLPLERFKAWEALAAAGKTTLRVSPRGIFLPPAAIAGKSEDEIRALIRTLRRRILGIPDGAHA